MRVSRRAEAYDRAVRIAKVWGCVCRPSLISTRVEGNTEHTSLRHQKGCRYRPAAFFEPTVEVDQAELDRRAKLMKRSRTTSTARANRAEKNRKPKT